MRRLKTNKLPQCIKQNARARVVVFNEFLQNVANEQGFNDIKKSFEALNSNGGAAYLVSHMLHNPEYWENLFDSRPFFLTYFGKLMSGLQAHTNSQERKIALQQVINKLQEYAKDQQRNILQYIMVVMMPIIRNTRCASLNIEPSFYVDAIKQVLAIMPTENQYSIKSIRQWFFSVVLSDLDRISFYDLDIADLVRIEASMGDLLIALRGHKQFLPKLIRFLHNIKQNNFDLFMAVYPLAILDSSLGENNIDYTDLLAMFPEFINNCSLTKELHHNIHSFLWRICNNNFSLIIDLITNKLEQYPSKNLVYYLAMASMYSEEDCGRTIIKKVLHTANLKPYLQAVVHGILESLDTVTQNESARTIGVITEMTKYKDIFSSAIMNDTYVLSAEEFRKLATLLFMIAALRDEEAWPAFVKEKVILTADLATVMENKGMLLLLRNLLLYYLGLHCKQQMSITEIAKRINTAMKNLVSIGFVARDVSNMLDKAMMELRTPYYAKQVNYNLTREDLNACIAELRREANKKQNISG